MSNQQLAVREKTENVRQTLTQLKPQFEMALPHHITPDRLIRVAMTAIQNTPKLLECDKNSLLSAIMTCAQLGLEPDGILGQAYLIPFKVQGQMRCQFMPGYKGLIALARNSGDVTSIQAQVVHEKDSFIFRYGLNEDLAHVPAGGDRGEVTHFYAIAKFKDGGHHWDVMTRAEVEAIRDGSQGYQAAKRYAKNGKINSPWEDHFAEMGKKTVIRRIAKYLPMDVQKANSIHHAAAIADAVDGGRPAHINRYGEIHIDDPAQIEDHSDEETTSTDTLNKFAAGDDEPAQAEEVAHDSDTGEVAEESDSDFPGDRPSQAQEARTTQASEYYQAGADAFIDGIAMEPPEDYSPAQKAEFRAGYLAAERAESEA